MSSTNTVIRFPPPGAQHAAACQQCDNRKWIYDKSTRSARPCSCRNEKVFEAKIKAIPPEFRYADLFTAQPDTARHRKQPQALHTMQQDQTESFLLCGENGSGKSFFGWALYREAVLNERKVYAGPLSLLMEDFRRMEIARGDWQPTLTAARLRQSSERQFIFLDEFEKHRPSEFASEKLFEVIDAAYSFHHQLVITSNLRIPELKAHWSREGYVWGNSIVRRLEAMCILIEMF